MTSKVIISIFLHTLEFFPYPNMGGGEVNTKASPRFEGHKEIKRTDGALTNTFCDAPTRNDGPKSDWSSERRVMAAKDFVFQ